MGRNVRATRVYQTVKNSMGSQMDKSITRVAPAWFKAIESITPSEIMTRPYAVQHSAPNARATKPKKLFKPTRIVYPEDKLRKEFFRDHPWELARPRIIMELDGEDHKYLDWSNGLRQRGMELSGECVVQRQLWLMENAQMTKDQAYDKARKEFYKLRHQEDVERRIAREEAQMYGAYFGKTTLQVGMELEDKQFENWKRWASEETVKMELMKNQAYTSFGEEALEPEEEAVIA